MTVEELKKFDKDIIVEVQYRDAGGEYYGTDNNIYLYVKNDILIL